MISLIIPTPGTNKNYTNNLISNIREIYPNEDEVEIILQEDDTVTLGVNYNNAVNKANGEKIILLHNDMVIKPGFIETMDKHIQKGTITTYTRVEPPIYSDTYPGKVLLDCGTDLQSFDHDKFLNFNIEEQIIDGGSQLFFGCMKEDYIGIDGNTFKMFCEDDDLHLRYKLAGFEHKVSSAHIYHFVSKTSRNGDYQQIEQQSNKNFIRKWGFRNSQNNIKYNIGFRVLKCNSMFLELLEPWCSNILIDDEMQVLTSHYIDKEQKNTSFNLSERIKSTPFESLENDIIVEFDTTQLNQQNFQLLQQLPDIIKESGEIGLFELGNLKIKINEIKEYQNDLIYLSSNT
jgi:hypothetical protein